MLALGMQRMRTKDLTIVSALDPYQLLRGTGAGTMIKSYFDRYELSHHHGLDWMMVVVVVVVVVADLDLERSVVRSLQFCGA